VTGAFSAETPPTCRAGNSTVYELEPSFGAGFREATSSGPKNGACWDPCSNNSVGQLKSTCCTTSWPVAYKAGLLLTIRKITL
jgi:hypothetical protein